MFIHFLFFVANLLIAGVVIRLIQAKYPNSMLGRALLFAY